MLLCKWLSRKVSCKATRCRLSGRKESCAYFLEKRCSFPAVFPACISFQPDATDCPVLIQWLTAIHSSGLGPSNSVQDLGVGWIQCTTFCVLVKNMQAKPFWATVQPSCTHLGQPEMNGLERQNCRYLSHSFSRCGLLLFIAASKILYTLNPVPFYSVFIFAWKVNVLSSMPREWTLHRISNLRLGSKGKFWSNLATLANACLSLGQGKSLLFYYHADKWKYQLDSTKK